MNNKNMNFLVFCIKNYNTASNKIVKTFLLINKIMTYKFQKIYLHLNFEECFFFKLNFKFYVNSYFVGNLNGRIKEHMNTHYFDPVKRFTAML